MKGGRRFVFMCCMAVVCGCGRGDGPLVRELAEIAEGWHGELIASVDQSYAGWDVEIGDADNDGKSEVLVTGCPDSRLYLFRKAGSAWETRLLAEDLAGTHPGMGLSVKVADLNRDGENEIILGTGQEGDGTAWFHVLRTDGERITGRLSSRPEFNRSAFTHDLAIHDLDGDGILEVISAYCGNGEIIRYDVDSGLRNIEARKLHQLSGSGEESLIADVDNDGRVEYITANAFRERDAKVEIFEFDDAGELVVPPRLVIDTIDGRRCFYVSLMVGDVDNDGLNELIAGWKEEQDVNRSSILAYRIDSGAETIYTFAHDDEDLDMGYFEKMMTIADADNDGWNELVVSTRGDNLSELIGSRHLGHVFLFSVDGAGNISRELLVDFDDKYAESSWLAVGDADGDGSEEIVLATGKGDRTRPGVSYVIAVHKD